MDTTFSIFTKMALCQIGLMFIFIYGVANFVSSSAMNIDQMATTNIQRHTTIHLHFYPKSVANLMLDFFKSYKHIKQLTLFMCNDNAIHSTSYSMFEHNVDGKPVVDQMQINESQFQQNHDSQQNRFSNFQQIVKYLMDSENFFIKAVGNVNDNDETDDDDMNFMYLNSIPDMLKCGDFKQGVVLDLRCHQSKYILQQASEYGLFNTSYHWMMLDEPVQLPLLDEKDEKDETLPLKSSSSSSKLFSFGSEYFERLNINMNSEITLVKPQQLSENTNFPMPEWNIYDLYDMWNPGKHYGGKLNVSHMGTYNADKRNLSILFEQTTIVRRLNVQGIKVRTMVVVTNRFNESFEKYLDQTYNPHLDSMNRFNYHLLSYVREMFNFRWTVYRTNSWGYLKNGTFDGMVGALVRKEIDVGGSPIFFRLERAKVIDYTARTWISRPCFIFRHPTGLVGNVFVIPFTNYVWYCILITGCLVIVSTSFISRHEPAQNPQNMESSSTNKDTFDANQSTKQQHPYQLMDAPLNRKRLQDSTEENGKFSINDVAIIVGNRKKRQNQIRRRHQSIDSMLNARLVQLHETIIPEREAYRQSKQMKLQRHTIAEENVIIRYCSKVFRKCFPSSSSFPPCTVQKMDQHRTKEGILCNESDESALSRCALLFIGALCQQGSSETPRNTSRKCIIMLILLFGFVVFQFYSASIVGSLLMEKPKTIKTLRNLIDSPLDVGIEDIVYNKDFFKRTTDADALDLYNKKVKVVNSKSGEITHKFYSPDIGMEKVKRGGFAFHADSATFNKIITDDFSERSICELSEIQLFPEQHMMAIVQKGSPIRKMITYGLRRTYEHGLLYYERKRWYSRRPQCVRQIQPQDLQVSLKTTETAPFILLLGMLMSLLVFMLEYTIWHYKQRISNAPILVRT